MAETVTEITVRPPNGGHPWASFADPVSDDGDHPWQSFADPVDEPSKWDRAKDIAKSGSVGVAKGAIGLAGFVGDLTDAGAKGLEHASNYVSDKLGVERYKRPQQKSVLHYIPTAADIQGAIEGQTGEFYKPQSTAGEYAQTIGEFLPAALAGPGGVVRKVGLQAVLPGVASEGAGQYLKGSPYETAGRIVAGVGAGIGGAVLSRPSNAVEALRQRLPEGITQDIVDEARTMMLNAKSRGIDLTWPEALSQASGRPVLSDTQRILESAPTSQARMQAFYADRPQQFADAAAREFDNIVPATSTPSEVGPTVSRVAQQAMRESPEGRILSDTMMQAGPRVSPEQAGNVIQQELRGIYDRREGMRNALADQDYAAARNAPATIPQDGGHRVADVTRHYLDTPDIPIILDPAERAAARTNWLETNNPTSRTPIVGERPTQFAQVDAGPVLTYLDDAIGEAKGAVRQGLQAARSALMRPDGTLDTTVAGLHNSRVAIGDLIDQATQAGARSTAAQLIDARNVLDQTLERVPAYGRARQNFQAASRPLDVFDEARVPGQIIERDQFSNRFTMPPERIPGTIQNNGPSGARDFNSVASPAAREAMEQHIATQVLDRASRDGMDVSAESIRQAIRQNEDVLRQYPGVRDRLESVAIAREGLAKIEQSPLGLLARKDATTQRAVAALFPQNPLPNSAHEVSSAVSELVKRRPAVARELVRTHLESVFNEATRSLQSGANQFGAAGFAKALVGNSQQRANLQAAVEALPDGRDLWRGVEGFLKAAQASGTRQPKGSLTAFNDLELKGMAGSGPVAGAVKLGASPGKWMSAVNDKWSQWQLGKNLDGLATIFTDPNSAALLKRVANMPRGSREAQALAARLTAQNLSRPEEKSRDAKR